MNTGNFNTGDYNTGNWNVGSENAGDYNTGDYNTGNWNVGSENAGNWNAGHGNAGDGNAGSENAGNWNAGHGNAGDGNAGSENAGNWNAGHRNAGDYNTGNYNTGFFCTETPAPLFFDHPVDGMTHDEARGLIPQVSLPVGCEWVTKEEMTDEEKAANPSHITIGGFLRVLEKDIRVTFPLAWAKLDDDTKQRFLDLPNFDADKFLAITGVDVRVKNHPREIVVDGVRYVRAD